MDNRNPKELYLEECLAFLLHDKAVADLATELVGSVDKVRQELGKHDAFSTSEMAEFADEVIEILGNAEGIDSAEIESLSSYSSTSTFYLKSYGGIYFVENFEFGDSGYFKSAQDAIAAVEQANGFKWNSPQDRLSEFSIDLLDSTDENQSGISINWNAGKKPDTGQD